MTKEDWEIVNNILKNEPVLIDDLESKVKFLAKAYNSLEPNNFEKRIELYEYISQCLTLLNTLNNYK